MNMHPGMRPSGSDSEADPGETGFLASHLRLEGARKIAAHQLRSRIVLAMIMVAVVYGIIVLRLVYFGFLDPSGTVVHVMVDKTTAAHRPDLLDRNGIALATDINTTSLYAEPRRIVDADEAVEMLSRVLPDLDIEETYKRLTSDAGFVWLKREMPPAEQARILSLGIPGNPVTAILLGALVIQGVQPGPLLINQYPNLRKIHRLFLMRLSR